ncbi:LCP family protein [Modestobacter roseus]|uniref:LCP family protein n=1 Tax=Modestobacter roseus TaxID=1181884 RepID=UPI001FB732BF|nr:LCP family protein [Modestobacter roseus]
MGRPPGSGARGDGAGRGSRRAAVVVRSLAAVFSVLLLAGSGWGWNLARVAEASVSRTDAIPDDGNSDVNGGAHAGAAMNLLLVGMDSRKGLTDEQKALFSTGDADGVLNTDSMMLVHVPADGSAASFVSLPRDTYVSIPGYGKARLNSAYARGYNAASGGEVEKDAAGAQLLVQTVSQFTGLRIDHFAEVNLLGFINLSTIVGGVEVNLCAATQDSYSGADFPAGVQTISGTDALSFVRQRHGLRSDLDRVVRQQVYIAGMLRNVLSSNLLLDLGKQQAIVEQVGSSITFDEGLNVFDLAAQMQNVDPGSLSFQTIPGLTDAKVDGADVLKPPSQAVVNDFFATLTADPAPAPPPAPSSAAPALAPSAVTVSVLNGSGVSGAAATAATALTAGGFQASSGGNAASTGTTTVRHRTGDEAAAALVVGQVPGAAVAVDDSIPVGAVQLVIGGDFEGVGQPVTVEAPASAGLETNERTATDTSCIH